MIKSKWIKILLIVLLLGSLSFAHEEYEEEEEFHIPKDLSPLHLSLEQKRKLKRLLINYQRRLERLYRKRYYLQKELKKLFEKERFDKERYISLSLQFQKELIETQAYFFQQLYLILTPSQRKKFLKYYKEWEIE